MLENTIENKGKFFAQYYGQKVLGKNKFSYQSVCANLFKDGIDGAFIELTPLSQITEEDAIEVANLQDVEFTNKRDIRDYIIRQTISDWVQYRTVDYLRLKSYLLPYNGTPTEKLIEYGWVKTKN